jgi:hypothetical protein
MRTRIVIVATQTIMDRSPRIAWQDPNGIHGFLPAFAVPAIERQPTSGIDMKPMQQSFDPPARFIHMVHFLG